MLSIGGGGSRGRGFYKVLRQCPIRRYLSRDLEEILDGAKI